MTPEQRVQWVKDRVLIVWGDPAVHTMKAKADAVYELRVWADDGNDQHYRPEFAPPPDARPRLEL